MAALNKEIGGMSGSFGKRARALLIFSAGLVPAAAVAQQELPQCAMQGMVSQQTSFSGDIYQEDGAPAVIGRISLIVEAVKVTPSDPQLLVSPTAALGIAYSRNGGDFVNHAFEVRNPFKAAQGETGETYNATIEVGGNARSFTMETPAFYNWITVEGWAGGEGIADLRKDITLKLEPADGSGQEYLFSFSANEARKAYGEAVKRIDLLHQVEAAGDCAIIQRYSSADTTPVTGCFLTTATCEEVGLADDCWELATLRRFRDGWLARQPGGAEDIAAYYREAPAIAARLKGDTRALLKLYWTRIVPSALAAELGANRLVRRIYARMMSELTAV
jgi:hypothetical protein